MILPRLLKSLPPNGSEKVGGDSLITVMWTCFDIDGDPLTYTIEYFDGMQWHFIQSGLTATTYEFDIPAIQSTTDKLQFRVKVSDGELTSDYGYSGFVTVDKDAPIDITVLMEKADGTVYKQGTWTNMSVTVTAIDIVDISDVSFSYAIDDKEFLPSTNITVEDGSHEVYIHAVDEFENAATFGGYPILIDKQNPVIPDHSVTLSGSYADIALTFNPDPGGSGNDYLVLPDGTHVSVGYGHTWATDKNGIYTFKLFDRAGNHITFTVEVDNIDVTPPIISCDFHGYDCGEVSLEDIIASLSFKDNESTVIQKGFVVTERDIYSGAYQDYIGDIVIGSGTYYIHAYGKNAFGLEVFETFGPFIVQDEASGSLAANGLPLGDVLLKISGKKLRLPGDAWSEELILEDIDPGVYQIEVMDAEGNISIIEVTITDYDIAMGKSDIESQDKLPLWIWITGIISVLFLLVLLLARNVFITIYDKDDNVLRKVRRLRRKNDTVIVDLKADDVRGSAHGVIKLTKPFTKRMLGRLLVVSVEGKEILNIDIPEDTKGRFEANIKSL